MPNSGCRSAASCARVFIITILLVHGVIHSNGLFYNLAFRRQAGNLRQRGFRPERVQQFRQLQRLRILFAAVAHGGGDALDQVGVRQAVFQRAQQRFDQAIAGAQLRSG